MLAFLPLLLPIVLSNYCQNIHYEGEGVKHYQDTFGYDRLILIGDIHSDINALKKIIKYTQARAPDTIVLLGDAIGRGDDTKEVLDYLMSLPNIVYILGNHENFQMDRRYYYVTEADSAKFGGAENRMQAFLKSGKYYEYLVRQPVVAKIGDLTLVHAGISKNLAKKYPNIEDINKLQNDYEISGNQGPLWYRAFGVWQDGAACPELNESLSYLNSKFMIMGHTLFPKITTRCKGKGVFIDTGISYAYNSSYSALEVIQSQGRTLQMRAIYPTFIEIIYSSFE